MSGWNARLRAGSCVPSVRLSMAVVAQVDDEGILADIGWNSFELQSLETSPSKESRVCRGKFTECLSNILIAVCIRSGRSLLHLRLSVLADGSV